MPKRRQEYAVVRVCARRAVSAPGGHGGGAGDPGNGVLRGGPPVSWGA
ncbi:hypothetical protein AAIB46_11520 [Streptomyces sp. 35M1]